MGGAAKGIANTVGRIGSGVFTLGGSEIARNNLSKKNVVNQVLNIPGTILTGGQSTYANPLNPGGSDPLGSGPSGPFGIDPAQSGIDQAAINNLGQEQYKQTLGGIADTSAARIQRAKDLFGQMLPGIAENTQAAHLYDSSGYGQEVGRQQANIASEIAAQEAQQRLGALQGMQGFQTGALQRGLSLEDFTNSANVAKAIGATNAPQVPSGKGGALSGGVSGASAGASFGPYAALLGGAGGAVLGSQANQKGGK